MSNFKEQKTDNCTPLRKNVIFLLNISQQANYSGCSNVIFWRTLPKNQVPLDSKSTIVTTWGFLPPIHTFSRFDILLNSSWNYVNRIRCIDCTSVKPTHFRLNLIKIDGFFLNILAVNIVDFFWCWACILGSFDVPGSTLFVWRFVFPIWSPKNDVWLLWNWKTL